MLKTDRGNPEIGLRDRGPLLRESLSNLGIAIANIARHVKEGTQVRERAQLSHVLGGLAAVECTLAEFAIANDRKEQRVSGLNPRHGPRMALEVRNRAVRVQCQITNRLRHGGPPG